MAKRITTGKRDREKLKEQKRKEKQQRKEERQSGGTTSFEDMIAYVDHRGVLHSTPPSAPTVQIDASEIAVSVPKQEEIEFEPLKGHVDHFNSSKGYGFISDAATNEKYFFHISAAPSNIADGNQVTFELERGARGMNAVRISITNNK